MNELLLLFCQRSRPSIQRSGLNHEARRDARSALRLTNTSRPAPRERRARPAAWAISPAPTMTAVRPCRLPSRSVTRDTKAAGTEVAARAMFVNEKGEWINSHNLGVDGPLMFLDKGDERQMHLYLLSFERHAFVGHFVVEMPK